MEYLGRHRLGRLAISLFRDSACIVSVLHSKPGGGAVVQAWKWLSLRDAQVKKPDIPALLLLASGHTLAFRTAKPTRRQAELVETPRDGARPIHAALKKVEAELEKEKNEYRRWRGVRDLEEANENLQDRGQEIWDLNQKILGTVQAPRIIHRPGNYIVSAWQLTDRMRLREQKSQAKDQQSKLRQRIDFSHRWRIQELEQKHRELKALLEEERKKNRAQSQRIEDLLDTSDSLQLTVLIRSTTRFLTGRKGAVMKSAAQEVERDASRFIVQAERVGFRFAVAPPLMWLPDASAVAGLRDEEAQALAVQWQEAWSLVGAEPLRKSLEDAIERMLDKPRHAGDVSRFPSVFEKRRMAYLGLSEQTPVLFDLDEQGPRHTAVVGGSGSGKSIAARLIVEGAALHGIPILIFDPTRAWTGLAQACSQKALLDKYDDFHLKRDWARGFPVRIAETVDPLDGITILSSTNMTAAQESAAILDMLTRLQRQMQEWPESKQLRLLLVLEEAHRYLKDKTLEPLLELFARTARAKGVGLLVVSQVAVDLPPAIRSNCATKIQLQTNYNQDLVRAAQVFGSDYKTLVPKLKQGEGLVHYPEFGTVPVRFRPPLHSPVAIPETLACLLTVGQDLKEAVARLVATNDATATRDTSAQETVQDTAPEPNGAPASPFDATDWRSVATRLLAKGKPSAREVQLAVMKKGLYCPSIRTIQRFQSEYDRRSSRN